MSTRSGALVFFACAACASTPPPRPLAEPQPIAGGAPITATRIAAPRALMVGLAGIGHEAVELRFRVCIDETGNVRVAHATSPRGLPESIATEYTETLQRWRFTPFTVGGHAFFGCDEVIFEQRRDAADAAGRMAARPHQALVTIAVVDRKYGRDLKNDLDAPPAVAADMRARKLDTVDPVVLICFDERGVADEIRVTGPANVPPSVEIAFQGWVGQRRRKPPPAVAGIPVRGCEVRTFHVVARSG